MDDFGESFNFYKLKSYYQRMFNVDILQIYKKENKSNYKKVKCGNSYCFMNNELVLPKFVVIIKDNNKKIFKLKVFRININYEYLNKEDLEANSQKDLYKLIDQKLFNYCNKRYINNFKRVDLNEFNDKHERIVEEINKHFDC